MEINSSKREDFVLVYEANYTLIMQVIVHIVDNLDLAEDLTQETFERFYLKNLTFPNLEEAKYWLLRVGKNLAFNALRKEKKEFKLFEKVKGSHYLEFKEKEEESVDPKEKLERVKKALSELPENLKLVLELKEFSHLDYKGIGKVLGLSVSNVKVRVFRARKKLEELLGQEDRDVY